MQFLKTLFWALLAAIVALFGWVNWNPVTVNLWANLQADIKLPVLLLIAFLLGWLPTWLIMRARMWKMRRRAEAVDRHHASVPAAEAPSDLSEDPVI